MTSTLGSAWEKIRVIAAPPNPLLPAVYTYGEEASITSPRGLLDRWPSITLHRGDWSQSSRRTWCPDGRWWDDTHRPLGASYIRSLIDAEERRQLEAQARAALAVRHA